MHAHAGITTMELLRTLCVIWGLVYAAEAQGLQCFHCSDDTDPICAFASLRTCAQGEVCMTSTTESLISPKQVSRRCVPIDRCGNNPELNKEFTTLYTNLGLGNVDMIGLCCNTTGCNKEVIEVQLDQRNMIINGLKCFTCNSTEDLICNRVFDCTGPRSRCTHGTVQVPPFDGKLRRAVGCVSPSWCDAINLQLTFFTPLATLSKFVGGPTCCNTNFCNLNNRMVASHGSASISHLTMSRLSLLTLAIWLWTFTHAQ